jgi:hypothetical protein
MTQNNWWVTDNRRARERHLVQLRREICFVRELYVRNIALKHPPVQEETYVQALLRFVTSEMKFQLFRELFHSLRDDHV